VVLALVWLAALTAMQWSVVRFRVVIVIVLTGAAVLLWAWVSRCWAVRLTTGAVAVVGVGTAAVTLTVPVFTYAVEPGRSAILVLHAVAVVAVAGILVLSRRRHPAGGAAAAIGVVALAHATLVALTIRFSPAPRIDVWVLLQQAADALGAGENIYGRVWVDSPGVTDAFTYLPWTAVLLAPGRWLAGDVRVAMLAWMLVALVGIWLLAGRARWAAGAGAMLVALAPGTVTQVDQAWTEPLLLALLVWWAVLVRRDHRWWAIVPLALACASKQHLVLVLPVLALWRGFGPARTLATTGLAGLLIAPWVAAGPSTFLRDTVVLLVDFHPIRFANTLYLLAFNVFGVTLPFWVPGVVVTTAVGAAAWMARRGSADLAWVLRACAAVLLTASLVNKQGFYNQFWLVATLVAVSLVVEAGLLTESAGAAPPATARRASRDPVPGRPDNRATGRRR
jgi:hypothetical protein